MELPLDREEVQRIGSVLKKCEHLHFNAGPDHP